MARCFAQIKYFRKMRGMTQTQLAVAAGMSEKNADVRITQYESEGRHPKKPLRESLARALHVNPAAISPPDMDSELSETVMEWLKMHQKMENGEFTKEEYDMWRYNTNTPDNTDGSQPLTGRFEEET
ncbi:MAG: helix-turn-helix domain-containing protein [Clostridiales bacterium]|nr:helix-turn-helix domain-containing protein [Clostridiales bacterium]